MTLSGQGEPGTNAVRDPSVVHATKSRWLSPRQDPWGLLTQLLFDSETQECEAEMVSFC